MTGAACAPWPSMRSSDLLFPYIDILRYGGTLPGMKGNRFRVACPDAEVINIFEIEMRTNPSPQKK